MWSSRLAQVESPFIPILEVKFCEKQLLRAWECPISLVGATIPKSILWNAPLED
jgi:hypothetical protein